MKGDVTRTLRVPLVSAALLVLTASAVGCEPSWYDDWDIETVYAPAVYVTGETKDTGSDAVEWEASDPRLSGLVTFRERMKQCQPDHVAYGGAPPNARVFARTHEVITADGRWSGTATALDVGHTDVLPETVILRGEGAYDGLTAYLLYAGSLAEPWRGSEWGSSRESMNPSGWPGGVTSCLERWRARREPNAG